MYDNITIDTSLVLYIELDVKWQAVFLLGVLTIVYDERNRKTEAMKDFITSARFFRCICGQLSSSIDQNASLTIAPQMNFIGVAHEVD